MESEQVQTFKFRMENREGELVVKGEITGETAVANFDDLKLRAIIALLNSVDRKNFILSEHGALCDSLIKEMEETISEMKRYEKFQGRTDFR